MADDFDIDIENEENLEHENVDSGKKYSEAQRKLVTQAVEFQIKNLASMIDAGQIDTSPKYQRRLRWDNNRKSKLIESILLNVPIPPVFLAEEELGRYSVIDGQQRLRTISEFFRNLFTLQGLEVFNELNGMRFDDLPDQLRNVLSVRPIFRCIILLEQSHPEIKFEVFERLNTGGVRLNPQEIRNSAYRGPLNDLILQLSEGKEFRKALGISNPEKSAVVQKMRDCELILRFFALKDTWREFKGSMKSSLNTFMTDNQKADKDKLSTMQGQFNCAHEAVFSAFGDTTFQRYYAEKERWGPQIVASLYDAEMLAANEILKIGAKINTDEARERLRLLLQSDDVFLDSILSGTNQPSKIVYRVEKIIEILS